MRLTSLFAAALSLASSIATATPIACSEVTNSHPPQPPPNPVSKPTELTNTIPPAQWKRDLILKGELPREACCSYGRCLGDVVVAMV